MVLTVLYIVQPAFAAFLAVAGSWTVPLSLWAISHWERVESVVGRLLRIPGHLWVHAERVGISAEMQGLINGARRSMLDELDGSLPHPVRVKFVRNPEDLAELRDGEVVIALGNHRRPAENLARATLAYVKSDLIRPARSYVDPKVLRTIDHSVTKRVLKGSDRNALDFFLNSIWTTELSDAPDLQLIAHEIETIERHGLLTRVILSEFLELGRRLYPEFPPPGVYETTRAIVGHLFRIVTKRPDEDLGDRLMFRSTHVTVGVVLVADREVAERTGARAYVWRCLNDIKLGCGAVYLLARGANASLIPSIIDELRGNGRISDIGEPMVYEIVTSTGPVTATCVRILAEQRGYGGSLLAESGLHPSERVTTHRGSGAAHS